MLLQFIHYTRVADELVISLFENNPGVDTKAIELFSHVLNAQHIWFCRINGKPEEYGRMQLHPVAQFREIHRQNCNDALEIFNRGEFTKEIHYTTSFGEQFTAIVEDILLHVCNHSTYHRAQIATLFKQGGVAPAVTDYALLKREGLL